MLLKLGMRGAVDEEYKNGLMSFMLLANNLSFLLLADGTSKLRRP